MPKVQVRIALLFGAVVATCVLFLATSKNDIATIGQISETAFDVAGHVRHPGSLSNLPNLPQLPKFHNPFAPPSHKPPEQAKSTGSGSSWFSDWKWKYPFSSTITLDENRAVLPPLPSRAPIYTYYKATAQKDEKARKCEETLLLIWRRAWWAQGFRPVVLGEPEAINNPFYKMAHRLKMSSEFRNDLLKWLAWDAMGGGIITDPWTFPMAQYHDSFLSFLRRGRYPNNISRYEGLENALLVGNKKALESAIGDLISKSDNLGSAKLMNDAASLDMLVQKPAVDSIAYYNRSTFGDHYRAVADTFNRSEAEGLTHLGQLVNSHLHSTWQSTFPDGIAVIEPMQLHTTALIEPAIDLARMLAQCSLSLMQSSCPPNNPLCRPCVAEKSLKLTVVPTFRNDSGVFMIGTVPHPYTITTLTHWRSNLNVRFIRRNTARDVWLSRLTKGVMAGDNQKGNNNGGSNMVVVLKEAVAGEFGTTRSLWLTAEGETQKDLNWIFGFTLPRDNKSFGTDEVEQSDKDSQVSDNKNTEIAYDVPDSKVHEPPYLAFNRPIPGNEELAKERELLDKARSFVTARGEPTKIRIREVVEAWNLLDTEAWHFTKAFSARRRKERLSWEKDEEKFAGAETGSKGWRRWFD